MRKLITLILIVCAWPASAGYYVSVSSSNVGWPVGLTSGCYLLPSMAAKTFATNATVYSVSGNSTSGQLSIYPTAGNITSWVVLDYGPCTTLALVAAIPAFFGSVTDPAINSSGGITDPSGGSSSSAPIEVTATVVQPEIAFLDPEQAVGNSVQWFGFTALLWALAWGGRRVIDLFTHST